MGHAHLFNSHFQIDIIVCNIGPRPTIDTFKLANRNMGHAHPSIYQTIIGSIIGAHPINHNDITGVIPH